MDDAAPSIEEASALRDFIDLCAEFEKNLGYKPYKALVGRAYFGRLVNETGPILIANSGAPPRVNGVILEVADG